MTLRVLDSSSSHASHKEFQLTLPDLINFPDFIVEKTRYDAAIQTKWEIGDECRVWWRHQSGEGGAWWEGRIESSQDKSIDFPNSPWERYGVVYETGETSLHSPWEFDNPQFPWENSTIEEKRREKLLSLFAGLVKSISKHQVCLLSQNFQFSSFCYPRNCYLLVLYILQDSYGIQKLNEAAQKMDFCNRYGTCQHLSSLQLILSKPNWYTWKAERIVESVLMLLPHMIKPVDFFRMWRYDLCVVYNSASCT